MATPSNDDSFGKIGIAYWLKLVCAKLPSEKICHVFCVYCDIVQWCIHVSILRAKDLAANQR